MSLIGLKSIEIPDNVTVELNAGDIVVAKGPLGELTLNVNDGISVSINDGIIQVNRDKDEKQHRALHGLTRSLISNMIIGITEGYKKELNLVGVGYTVFELHVTAQNTRRGAKDFHNDIVSRIQNAIQGI